MRLEFGTITNSKTSEKKVENNKTESFANTEHQNHTTTGLQPEREFKPDFGTNNQNYRISNDFNNSYSTDLYENQDQALINYNNTMDKQKIGRIRSIGNNFHSQLMQFFIIIDRKICG